MITTVNTHYDILTGETTTTPVYLTVNKDGEYLWVAEGEKPPKGFEIYEGE